MRPDRVPVFYCDNSPLIIFSSLCTLAIKRNGFLLLRKRTFLCSLWVFPSQNCLLCSSFFLVFVRPNFSKSISNLINWSETQSGWNIIVESVLGIGFQIGEGSSYSCGRSFILLLRLEPIDIPKLIQFTCVAIFRCPHMPKTTRMHKWG